MDQTDSPIPQLLVPYLINREDIIYAILQPNFLQYILLLASFLLSLNLTIPPHFKAFIQLIPMVFFIFSQAIHYKSTALYRRLMSNQYFDVYEQLLSSRFDYSANGNGTTSLNSTVQMQSNKTTSNNLSVNPSLLLPIMNNYIMLTAAITTLIYFLYSREQEKAIRLHHIVMHQSIIERSNVYRQAKNARVALEDILPAELVQAYISCDLKIDHDKNQAFRRDVFTAGVAFAKIVNFDDFYNEVEENGDGKECLRILNELIADFDKIILLPYFKNDLVKIKTIGSTYMVASGLTRENMSNDPSKKYDHIKKIADYCLRIKAQLDYDNIHLRGS